MHYSPAKTKSDYRITKILTAVLTSILTYWKILSLVLFILTSITRVAMTNDVRDEFRDFSELLAREEAMIEETRLLRLERGVLSRPSRLTDYAEQELQMAKPQDVRQMF